MDSLFVQLDDLKTLLDNPDAPLHCPMRVVAGQGADLEVLLGLAPHLRLKIHQFNASLSQSLHEC